MNLDRRALRQQVLPAMKGPEMAQCCAVSGFLRSGKLHRHCIKELNLLDPCMGSGHILVYAFDVLMQIYESAGYGQRDAARSILENNLYGLDIDDRAFQMAYFAIMMKARQYNRRILNGEYKPNVYSIQESNGINRDQLKYFGAGLNEIEKNNAITQMNGLLDTFKDAKEYGSILTVDRYDWGLLDRFVSSIELIGQMSMYTVGLDDTAEELKQLIAQGKVLAQKYHAIITNPPYMGGSGMSPKLSEYVKNNYPDTKSDMSTVFMEKTISMCLNTGYMAMINIPVWMFLSSYEKLRNRILNENTFVSMLHFGRGVFGSDFGTTAFVIKKKHIDEYRAVYRKLFERQGTVDSLETKEQWFFEGKGKSIEEQESFLEIPGTPIAYSLGKKLVAAFASKRLVSTIGDVKQGLATGDNNRFLRLWYEVDNNRICFEAKNAEMALESRCKWFPYNKGGAYRKWYGNIEYVVNWEHDGYEIKNIRDENGKIRSRPQNLQYFFKESLTWSKVTIGGFSMRYVPAGAIFDVAGCSLFPHGNYMSMLANMNSCVQRHILSVFSQSVNYEVGQIAALPMIDLGVEEQRIAELAQSCVLLSKNDWDSFENSWNFTWHPLLNGCRTVREAYDKWKAISDDRFVEMHKAEEEINERLIAIYGLGNEVSPEVKSEEITVRKADMQRDIKSLISYAVGCMFGRYSLSSPGLTYAGGTWEEGKYGQFKPDVDNIIPISDEEYLEDDIVSRFCAFLKNAFGENTLEENLDYIANALGNKGNSSREVIRNYFLEDFFKDHCQTYSVTGSGKRPIYWLFDSGKQNGFKALIYLHRYNADTIGNLRIDYLHRMQRIYESEISRMQDMIDHSTNAREVAQATKRREKLTKQLKECREYDEKLAHLALSRIELDLDDGVKKNYRKIQTANDGKFYEVLADSKNIMAKE